MKKLMISSKLWLSLMSVAVVSACSNTSASQAVVEATATVQSGAAPAGQAVSAKLSDLVTFDQRDTTAEWSADESTTITLNGTAATIVGSGAAAADGSVHITASGTYVLKGALSDGQIVVDVQDEGTVRLVLNGVDIQDSDSAAIYIKEAGKTVITLQEGTENTVADGAAYVYADAAADEPSAAIFSKSDLAINGTGSLKVTANYKDGITSKDDLKIVSGLIGIQSADDGLVGKDMVAVQEGKITIVAGGDGIKSTNDTEADKGFVAIAGGTFDIKAVNDGIQAETTLVADGGTYNLITGGGSANGEVKVEARGPEAPGSGTASATADSAETETASMKGLKAGGDVAINGGTWTIDAADDAIHGNGNVAVAAGAFTITTGDDGIHADALLTIADGKIDIKKSYEGLEGANITVLGGETHLVASDDGVNVAGGNDASAAGGSQGQDQFTASGSNQLTLSGGILTVDATGDGLDSNGSISMTGGTVTVNGPTNNGNGPLDYDGSFVQSAGTLVAAGSSGMVQAPSGDSTQFSVAMTYPQVQQAGTLVQLQDSEGNAILTFAPSKNYQSVVISSPDLKEGAAYTLYSGGTSTGSEANGLYTKGEYTGGTQVVGFKISSSVTWLNESGVTTGNTGGPGLGGGGRGGIRPEGGKVPEGGVMPEGGMGPGSGDTPVEGDVSGSESTM